MQEGFIAAIKAAKTFDHTKQIRFSTWVYRPVYWSMLKFIMKQQKYEKLIKTIKEYEI